MSACQLADFYIVADKVVIYADLNRDESAVMINNSWVPIPNPQTNILEIVNSYKKQQTMLTYGPLPGTLIELRNVENSNANAQKAFATNPNSVKP